MPQRVRCVFQRQPHVGNANQRGAAAGVKWWVSAFALPPQSAAGAEAYVLDEQAKNRHDMFAATVYGSDSAHSVCS